MDFDLKSPITPHTGSNGTNQKVMVQKMRDNESESVVSSNQSDQNLYIQEGGMEMKKYLFNKKYEIYKKEVSYIQS